MKTSTHIAALPLLMIIPFLPVRAFERDSLDTGTSATATNDSVDGRNTSRDLEEFVVKADAVIRKGNVTKAYPSKRDKSMAPDLIGVLANMALPDILIDPMTSSVKTLGGQNIAIFVDFMPASSEDIRNMRPQDVERIDIIRNPEDPRFSGSQVVANYIMKKYEYGGYTRFNTEQNVLLYSGDLSAFSRMTYGSMAYDLSGGTYHYEDCHRKGSEGEFLYRFPDLELAKKSFLTASHGKFSNPRARFRATYNHSGTTISNDIGFSNACSDNITEGSTVYSALYGDGKYKSASDYKIWRYYWNGNYSFSLPDNFMLGVSGKADWTIKDDSSEYASDNDTPIINDNSENRFSINGSVGFAKIWSNNSIGAGTEAEWERVRLDYRSATARSVTSTSLSVKPYAFVNLTFGKFGISPNGSAVWRRLRVDDYTNIRWSGQMMLPMMINISSRQYVYFNPQYDLAAPSLTDLSPVTVRRTTTDATVGNERLGYTGKFSADLTYSYMLGSWLSVAVNFVASHETSQVVPVYAPGTTPELNHVMVRSLKNDGTLTRAGMYLSLRGNYFGNRLLINVWGYGGEVIRTGMYSRRRWISRLYATATYNISNFKISAFYGTPYKDCTPVADYMHSVSYGISGAWGWKDLYAEIGSYNMFGKSGIESTSVWYGDSYSGTQTQLGNLRSAPWVYLKLSYSFSYGRKTSKSDELKDLKDYGSTNILR